MGNTTPGYVKEAEDAPLEWGENIGYAIFALVLGVIVMVGGLLGNCLVLALVISKRSLQNVTHIFISMLAVADIIILLTCMPWTLYTFYYTRNWPVRWGPSSCNTIMFFQVFAVLLCTFTLWAMAVERYMAVLHPFGIQERWRRRHAIAVCLVVVLISFCLALPRSFLAGMLEYRTGNDTNTFCVDNIPNTYVFYYNIFRVLFFYIFPMVTIAIMYTKIIRVIRNDQCKNTSLVDSRKKVIKMLIAMVAIFAICWFPYHAFLIVQILPYGKLIIGTEWFHYLILLTSLFMYLNCISNPIIYTLMSKQHRVGFRRLICCCTMPPDDRGPWTSKRQSTLRSLIKSRNNEREQCEAQRKNTSTLPFISTNSPLPSIAARTDGSSELGNIRQNHDDTEQRGQPNQAFESEAQFDRPNIVEQHRQVMDQQGTRV